MWLWLHTVCMLCSVLSAQRSLQYDGSYLILFFSAILLTEKGCCIFSYGQAASLNITAVSLKNIWGVYSVCGNGTFRTQENYFPKVLSAVLRYEKLNTYIHELRLENKIFIQ